MRLEREGEQGRKTERETGNRNLSKTSKRLTCCEILCRNRSLLSSMVRSQMVNSHRGERALDTEFSLASFFSLTSKSHSRYLPPNLYITRIGKVMCSVSSMNWHWLVSQFAFCCCTETLIKSNVGEESIYLVCLPDHGPSLERSGQQLKQEPGSRCWAKSMEKCCCLLASQPESLSNSGPLVQG